MKQTIEIEVPDGKKAVWKDGKVVFEDIKPQLPKTWEEFCEQNKIKEDECYLNYFSEIKEVPIRERLDSSDRIILPNKQAAEAHLALMQLHQLRDCWREGWLPNWKDDNQKKYVIVYNKGEFEIWQYHTVNHFLAFQDEKRSEEFLINFRELIEQVGDLI